MTTLDIILVGFVGIVLIGGMGYLFKFMQEEGK